MALHPALPWTLRAIARLERVGDVRKPRLTEPGLPSFERMRRKLTHADLIELLHEDLAATFPLPFAAQAYAHPLFESLEPDTAQRLIAEATGPDDSDTLVFLRAAARALGLPAGGNIAELPRVQPHQTVLELPGSGGRIAAQQLRSYPELSIDQFTFVADSDAERAMIGLVAVELRANAPRVVTSDALRKAAKRFDVAYGVPAFVPAEVLADELGVAARWA